jgi:hypothetical protein
VYFRSSETRPFLKTGLTDDGVSVLSSKRKKGQVEVLKIREWSTRLRVVVAMLTRPQPTNTTIGGW